MNHFGKLYRAMSDTTAEQDNAPDIDQETWREVVTGGETSGNDTLEELASDQPEQPGPDEQDWHEQLE